MCDVRFLTASVGKRAGWRQESGGGTDGHDRRRRRGGGGRGRPDADWSVIAPRASHHQVRAGGSWQLVEQIHSSKDRATALQGDCLMLRRGEMDTARSLAAAVRGDILFDWTGVFD